MLPFLLGCSVESNGTQREEPPQARPQRAQKQNTGRTNKDKQDATLEGRITAPQLESTALKAESHGDKSQEQNQTPHNILYSSTQARDSSEAKEWT